MEKNIRILSIINVFEPTPYRFRSGNQFLRWAAHSQGQRIANCKIYDFKFSMIKEMKVENSFVTFLQIIFAWRLVINVYQTQFAVHNRKFYVNYNYFGWITVEIYLYLKHF